ncbi:MAG: ABC transporter permease [Firmicutes bacterium]|jgi:ABC-2 type transport system permease protein|nr:ABC transporter permease [Bacillota bacterium]
MQVFKAYFKVMRGSAASIAVNLCVFLGISVLVSSMAPAASIMNFEPTRIPVAVINRDSDGQLAQGLVDYLGQTSRLVPYPDDPEKLQDALFFRNVGYIAIIPAGFSDAFMSGRDCAIEKVIVPDSTSSYYVDMSIDRFLNTVRLHRKYSEEESQAELVAAARADLAFDTAVAMKSSGAATGGERPAYTYYFAYCAYALLAMVMTGVSSIMIAFNKPDLYLRNLCSPLPGMNMSLQLAAGHAVFALGCWAILVVGSFVLHGQSLMSSKLAGLYSLNTLAFAAVSACIGFLVGSFVKSNAAQAGAINVITLGMSFLGGVFVPQSVMSKSVLSVGRFLPSYWFVRANDAIGELSRFDPGSLRPIYGSILIQLGFAAALFSVALLLSKERRLSQL